MVLISRDNRAGVNWVDSASDEAFRKGLVAGCPSDDVRRKMREALAVIPEKNCHERSKRYFGKELPNILVRTAPLIDELELTFYRVLGCPGFKRWLVATGYANEYRMIKAMVAWADHVYVREEAEKQDASVDGDAQAKMLGEVGL